MKLRVLGCAGAEFPGHFPSAFLLDDSLLLDAGTVGAVLSEEEQLAIRHILVSHAHLDHIRGIPLLADNLVVRGASSRIDVVGTAETVRAIRDHLMNDVIWPDFSRIPTPAQPTVSYLSIEPLKEMTLDGFSVTAFPVHHSVPAVGYKVKKGGCSLVYTGDTGPTDLIWKDAAGVEALIVEVSFPDHMEELALLTGHLTPRLLARELDKIPHPPKRILVTHIKLQHFERIAADLDRLGLPSLEILEDGRIYEW